MKNIDLISFRQDNKLTQTELAAKLDVPQSLIAMVEKGTRKAPQSLKNKLKEVFDFELKEPETIENFNENIIALPVHDIGAAAGAGTWLSDEPEINTMFFDKRFLKQILRTDNYSSLHIIHATGDSMDSGWNQPNDIKDGDLLMVDTSQTTGNNQIFVILVNNSELRVKRLFKRGDVLYISSNNPKYEEETYYPNNSDIEIKVIGRVIWNGSKENV